MNGLECSFCGNKNARKLFYSKERVGCDACFDRSGVRPAYLHTYENPYHRKLSVAKEKVFERSFIEPGSGEVLDRDTGKEAAY